MGTLQQLNGFVQMTYDTNGFVYELIIFLLLFCIIISFRKKQYIITDTDATVQMRGFAILIIIFFHYITWYFTPTKYYTFVLFTFPLGSMGVSLFLTLSGFGLMSSYLQKGFEKLYLIKRLLRIYLPYWCVSLLWIFLDYRLYHVIHTRGEIVKTLLGIIVTNSFLETVDPFMWYITFILLSYILFYVIMIQKVNDKLKLIVLLLLPLFAFTLSENVHLEPINQIQSILINMLNWRTYLLNFSVGGILAYCMPSLSSFLQKLKNGRFETVFFIILLLSTIVLEIKDSSLFIGFFPVFFIGIIASLSVSSLYLTFIGDISYEMYLVHGALMLRYNYLLYREPLVSWFFLYLACVMFVAFLLHELITKRFYSFLVSTLTVKLRLK